MTELGGSEAGETFQLHSPKPDQHLPIMEEALDPHFDLQQTHPAKPGVPAESWTELVVWLEDECNFSLICLSGAKHSPHMGNSWSIRS